MKHNNYIYKEVPEVSVSIKKGTSPILSIQKQLDGSIEEEFSSLKNVSYQIYDMEETHYGLQKLYEIVHTEQGRIKKYITNTNIRTLFLKIKRVLLKAGIYKFYKRNIKAEVRGKIETKNTFKQLLKHQLQNCIIRLNHYLEPSLDNAFKKTYDTFKTLTSSNWQLYVLEIKKIKSEYRTNVNQTLESQDSKFSISKDPYFKNEKLVPSIKLTSDDSLYIYPGFLIIGSHNKIEQLIDIQNVSMKYYTYDYKSKNEIADSHLLQYTWEKAKLDGERDERYKENTQMYLHQFGQLEIHLPDDITYTFLLSQAHTTDQFVKCFNAYVSLIKR